METNVIMLSDSYKYSHWKQYPANMVSMFDYAEARSDKVYPKTVFFGLQYYIDKYLMNPITAENIDEANDYASRHGIPFNKEDWEYILNEHKGYLPVRIRAVREGMLIPTKNVLFTVESTDKKVPWVAGFLETLLMKVWYTSNVATRSYYVRKEIEKYYEKTEDPENDFAINFSYHNFGDRGSSSPESAAIGGVAHLTQFMGTDNFNSLRYAEKFYDEPNAGFSIPATEHSTTTAWGKDEEFNMIRNHIEVNKDSDIVAAVCDSYDYLETVRTVTSGDFKAKIESDEYPKFVIRPDSGSPVDMIMKTLDIMEENGVSYTVNSKGFKVFKKYGIIWGDGIDEMVIKQLLWVMKKRGYAASNIAFGSGGWLMQQHDRDTQGWAVKCSSITVDEGSPIENGFGGTCWEEFLVERDVFKSPITAPNKKSKKGRLTLWYNHASDTFFTDSVNHKSNDAPLTDMLNTVYENGVAKGRISLAEVRENSKDKK
jgi:nicotinamide phosphoribosyltransferase